jgi:hypothetical protein
MPQPWLLNLWACNPFAAEPDRNAALAIEAMGISFETSPDDLTSSPLVTVGGEVNSIADWSASLTADWPTVANVIPKDLHVFESHSQEVLDFVNARLGANEQRVSLECFHYAQYQLYLAGFRPSGPPAASPETILVLHEYVEAGRRRTEVQAEPMVRAVEYLKAALLAETPVMIGVRIDGFEPRPNDWKSTPYIEPTNHFVVAVGMGHDDLGPYLSFFDYSHRQRDYDRFYLQPNLIMESPTGRVLTEVRRSRAR